MRTRGKICFALVLFVVLVNYSFAQTSSSPGANWSSRTLQPNANFYTIRDGAKMYYETNPELITTIGSGYKDFLRWEWFWRDRVDAPNSNRSGSFQYASDALQQLLQNPIFDRSSGSIPSDWSSLGPNNLSTQSMGIVISVAVHPTNSNTIFVGTNASGCWRTQNGGANWSCITDIANNLGLPGVGVQNITIDPTNTNTMYIATGVSTYGAGVFKTINANDPIPIWTPLTSLNDKIGMRGTSKIFINPNNTNVLFALVVNEIWRSVDGGANWGTTPVLTLSTPMNGHPRFWRDIESHPTNPNIIYVSSDDQNADDGGAVIYRTTDGGANWSLINGSWTGFTVNQIKNGNFASPFSSLNWIADPSTGGWVWDNVNQNAKIFPDVTSKKLYQNFFFAKGCSLKLSVFSNIPSDTRLVIQLDGADPTPPQIIYDSGFVTSLTSGTINLDFVNSANYYRITFIAEANVNYPGIDPLYIDDVDLRIDIKCTDRIAIAVTRAEANSLYAVFRVGSNFYFLKSADEGDTWGMMYQHNPVDNYGGNLGGTGYWRLDLVVSPLDANIIYVGGFCISKSTNGGAGFSNIGNCSVLPSGTVFHVDVRALIIDPNSSDILWQGNDGGISKTTDGGNNWQNLNGTGLSITQFYGIGLTEMDGLSISGGTQDNHAFTYNHPANPNGWIVGVVGDAYDCAIDKFNPQIRFIDTFGGSFLLQKSTNGGGSWGTGIGQPSGKKDFIDKPLLIDNANDYYVGYHDVFKSTNQGGSWEPTPNSGGISRFTTNNGVSIGEALRAIDVAPSNSDVVYAAFSEPTWGNTPEKKFFMTQNGGNTSWTDISSKSGISEVVKWINMTDIKIYPTDKNKVWVSTGGFWIDNGVPVVKNRVLYSSDGGNNWTDYSDGLTVFPVNCLVYQNGTNYLYVGTDAGVFVRDISIPIGDPNSKWEPFSANLPVCIVTDLEINYCAGVIRAATFGRGVWESPLPVASRAPSLFINRDTHFNFPVTLAQDLVIQQNKTLYMENTLSTSCGASIYVRSGATLIIENNAQVTLNVDNGIFSKVVVEQGGKLTLNSNNITLNGIETAIEVHGTLQTANNVDLTFNGDGLLRFFSSNTLLLGNDSKINLQGFNTVDAKGDIVLSMEDDGCAINLFKHDLTITNGDVRYATNSKIYIEGTMGDIHKHAILGNVFLSNVDLKPNTNGAGVIGIEGLNVESVVMDNCAITDISEGIKLVCDNIRALQPTFTNCIFRGCAIGVEGDNLSNPQFTNCTFNLTSNLSRGIFMKNMDVVNVNGGLITRLSGIKAIGVDLDNVIAYEQNGTEIINCFAGIQAISSNVFLDNLAIIKSNVHGIFFMDTPVGSPASSLHMGLLDCAQIINNGTGVEGTNVFLDIDAVDHMPFHGGILRPNSFDGNTLMFAMCWTDGTDNIPMKGNYWGPKIPTGPGVSLHTLGNYLLKKGLSCPATTDVTFSDNAFRLNKPNGCDNLGIVVLSGKDIAQQCVLKDQNGLSISDASIQAHAQFFIRHFKDSEDGFDRIAEDNRPQIIVNPPCRQIHENAIIMRDVSSAHFRVDSIMQANHSSGGRMAPPGWGEETDPVYEYRITNHPNPFSDKTTFSYGVANDSKVSLEIYSITGQLVTKLLNETLVQKGNYQMDWNTENIPAGVYFYRYVTPVKVINQKLVIVK